jgi:mRNA guanylyltransferase
MNKEPPEPNSMLQKVGAVWAGAELEPGFQQEVAGLLGRSHRGFPGAQPVSFGRKHINELMIQDYYVCEKTDGVRYLMYLTVDGPENDIHYLIDRKNNYWYVQNLHFPHHEDPTFARFHDRTILDGELVEDRYADGTSEIKFLVFDCLVLDGNNLMGRTLDKRLAYWKSHVRDPYRKFLQKHPDQCAVFPFKVEDKSTQFSYSLATMFNDIIPKVKKLHGNDGLIFTCRSTPYRPGTDEHILKWKPPGDNTIDFLLQIVWPSIDPDPNDPDQSLQPNYLAFPLEFNLFVNYGSDEYEKHGSMYVTLEEWERMKAMNIPLQYAIVECYLEQLDATNGGMVNGTNNGAPRSRWRFYRFREDKADANHISTFNSVIESIQDHVTEEDLLKHADAFRDAWKARDKKMKEAGRS